MSEYLGNIIERHLPLPRPSTTWASEVRPRLASHFEPSHPSLQSFQEPYPQDTEVTDYLEASIDHSDEKQDADTSRNAPVLAMPLAPSVSPDATPNQNEAAANKQTAPLPAPSLMPAATAHFLQLPANPAIEQTTESPILESVPSIDEAARALPGNNEHRSPITPASRPKPQKQVHAPLETGSQAVHQASPQPQEVQRQETKKTAQDSKLPKNAPTTLTATPVPKTIRIQGKTTNEQNTVGQPQPVSPSQAIVPQSLQPAHAPMEKTTAAQQDESFHPMLRPAINLQTRQAHPIARRETRRPVETQLAAAPEPTIHITIGRIEVHSTPPTARSANEKQSKRPTLALDEYLRKYGGKR